MEMHNVHLARPLPRKGKNSVGEATVAGSAKLTGSGVSVKNVRFRAEDSGRIAIKKAKTDEQLETRADGGPIQIE